MGVRPVSRRLAAVVATVVGLLVVAPVGPSRAAPESVDAIVARIAANVAAGHWARAERSIEALDRTIRDELRDGVVPVYVVGDPVRDRRADVTRRLRLLRADERRLLGARERLGSASAQEARALVGQVAADLATNLNLVSEREAIDAVEAVDLPSAGQVAGSLERIKERDRMVRYLTRLVGGLGPAVQQARTDRSRLADLGREFEKVLAGFGLGPPYANDGPSPGDHPIVDGIWASTSGPCAGALITFVQDGPEEVSAASADLPACAAAWVADDIRWDGQAVLEYDYTLTRRPQGWSNGTHRVTFARDGRTATLVWTDSRGDSASVSLARSAE